MRQTCLPGLCTVAGTIMEDVAQFSLIRPTDAADMTRTIAALHQVAKDIAALASAAEVAARRDQRAHPSGCAYCLP